MLCAPQHAGPAAPARLLACLMLLALLLVPAQPLHPVALPVPAPALPVAEQLGRLPLAFEPAAPGSQARFQARALGGVLFFSPGEVLLTRPDSAALRVRFLGADPATAVEPSDPLPGRVSRFIGDDPAHWQRDLSTSAALVYRRLYPGVDLRYDGASERLKGTYLVEPEADPAAIRWRYDGAQGVRLDPSGDLLITLASSEAGDAAHILAERAPVAWQDTAAGRVPVGAAYDLAADGSVGFRLDQYDPALPLVIDPTLVFSTYLGGVGFDTISTIAFDQQGNIYAAGHTTSTGSTSFRTHKPIQPDNAGDNDVVLLKLSPTGTTVLFSTYLGGTGEDAIARVLVDRQGIALVGNTTSADFPATLPRLGPGNDDRDFFIARLNSQGTALLWSRTLGGSGDEEAIDAALDGQGQITVSGATRSADFPAGMGPVYQPEARDGYSAVIAQLSADGQQLLFRTFLGGKYASLAAAIALAADGSIVVGGTTYGSTKDTPQNNFPVKNPLPGQGQFQGGTSDAFIARLTPGARDLVWSTFLGGDGAIDDTVGISAEGIGDLALDEAGRIYATGTTTSDSFPQSEPRTARQQEDGFVSILSADGQTLEYSRLLGGNREDRLGQIALDAQGNIYLMGRSNSEVQPLVNPVMAAPQMPSPVDGGFWPNLLLIKLSNDGRTTLIRTVLGGIGSEINGGMAVSSTGRVALSGHTDSDDLPLQNAIQPRPAKLLDDFDGMLMLIDTAPQLELEGSSNPAVLPPCAADPCPPVSFAWTLDAPYRVDTTLAITLPAGLDVVPGSVSGATLSGKTLRASGSPKPGSPQRVGYQVRTRAALPPGSLLTTTARATVSGGATAKRNLILALPSPAPAGRERTLVLIYASGDNDQSQAMLQLANNAERATGIPGLVALLLLDGPGVDDTFLYRLQPPAPGQPDCMGRLRDPSCGGRYQFGTTYQKWSDNLANPDTLADFLVAAQRAFPAERRVLSLAGHGSGWMRNRAGGQPDAYGVEPSRHGGQFWDQHPKESLSTAELGWALAASSLLLGTPLDLLYLDASSMGQIEVAYELRDSARYLLTSPNWKWAAFPYDKHLADATRGDGRAIGEAWIANEEKALAGYLDEPYTYTLLDLGRIDALRGRIDNLTRLLETQPPELVIPAFRRAERYDSNQDGALDGRDNTVDLGSFSAQLAATPPDAHVFEAATQVQQGLQQAVVRRSARRGRPQLFPGQTWSWPQSAGLAIYLPLGQDSAIHSSNQTQVLGADNWSQMLSLDWEQPALPDDLLCDGSCRPPRGQLPHADEIFLPLVRR